MTRHVDRPGEGVPAWGSPEPPRAPSDTEGDREPADPAATVTVPAAKGGRPGSVLLGLGVVQVTTIVLALAVLAFLLAWSPSISGLGIVLATVAAVGGVVSGVRTAGQGRVLAAAATVAAAMALILCVVTTGTVGTPAPVAIDDAADSADADGHHPLDDLEPLPGEAPTRVDDGVWEVGTGTGGGQVPPEAAVEVVEVASGPGDAAFGDDDDWWYLAVLENRSDVALEVSLGIDALAADGTLLDVTNQVVTVLPGRSAVAGDFYGVGRIDGIEPARVSVRMARLHRTPRERYAEGAVQLSPLTVVPVAGEGLRVEGTVTSTLPDRSYPLIVVVARDPRGHVVAVAPGITEDDVAAGAEEPFDARFFTTLPADVEMTAFVSFM